MKTRKEGFIKSKMKNEKIIFILILIIILATALRIINLANWPASFNQDEALNGYEAYSILKTGRDHRGNFLPVFFEGFSDQVDNRLPLYIYSTIPWMAIFGLDKFATRLPSAIFGILTVIITYFLAKELFKKESIALLAAFFLTISPWHIFLSRLGIEAITVPLFSVLTIFFFLIGLRKNKIFILFAGLSLALLFYTYHIAKLLTPLLGGLLLVFYWKEVKENRVWFLSAFLIFLIISFPFLFIQFGQWTRIQTRFNQISIFNFSFWPAFLIYNFLTYLTPKFLFTHYPFFIIILFFISLFLIKQMEAKFLFILILISLLPVVILIFNPHSHRSMSIIPFIEILAAFGGWQILNRLKELRVSPKIGYFSFVLIFLFLSFFNLNFLIKNKYPYNFLNGFYQYVPKEVIDYLKENQDKYEKIVFTNKANQPYIFFLFYLNYPPEKFQSLKIKRDYLPDGLQIVNSFDKYRFCDLNECYSPEKNNLYVARINEITDLEEKKIFYTVNGSVFRIITND